jgi:hypothetical protein
MEIVPYNGVKQLSIVNEEDEFNFDGSRSDMSVGSRGISANSDFTMEDHNVSANNPKYIIGFQSFNSGFF